MRGCAFVFFMIPALLRADSQHILHASFPDGTGLEVFTETTGSSEIDFEGGMGIGPGDESKPLVDRIVTDRSNQILFAYHLEASRGATPNTVMIRIKPISAAAEDVILRNRPFKGEHLPTVAGVREFQSVRIGEVVTLDILYNPSTGEKIFDVLRPIAAATGGMSVSVARRSETISLKDIGINVNGRIIAAPASLMIGSAVRIDIPGHGAYVLAAYDPGKTGMFAPVAHAEGRILTWAIDGEKVEITSTTSVLSSGKGLLWLYRDLHYQPAVVGLLSADTVDWLLPSIAPGRN
jgi:hypothetical protein